MNYSTTILHYSTNDIDAINVISDTVDRLAKHILPKLRGGRDFVIVGYSFGSIIAFELTRKLEAMNLKGRLVLIDGTPELMQTMYRDFISNSNEVDLQTVVLSNILEIYTERISDEILMELKSCKNWEERYNAFAKQFLGMNTSLSPTNLRILCTSVYKYSAAIRQYDPSTLPRIKSSIILLKATMSHTTIEGDYGLHKITEGVVEIHYIEGSHLTILRNEKVPAAINGELHI
ncbi:fatty acid synthase-like [Pogonomyrmex barbatus]|uniref:oleoyl-[acyl-carrier-protein] hydrolase n=1 Tax=Pogonomyrmex barbatus TaxID=144034 RepID=A0A6I9VQG8_9HYME|nr:fatty acid synthase-like [Pogonomyrmex barbatus]